jgi:hypothetical protein
MDSAEQLPPLVVSFETVPASMRRFCQNGSTSQGNFQEMEISGRARNKQIWTMGKRLVMARRRSAESSGNLQPWQGSVD